jgi:hypothetical protein
VLCVIGKGYYDYIIEWWTVFYGNNRGFSSIEEAKAYCDDFLVKNGWQEIPEKLEVLL